MARSPKKDTRGTRHSRAPLIQAQIRALRTMAAAGSSPSATDESAGAGLVLATTMAAGFALELGLKLFYMTFHLDGPPTGHELKRLFDALDNRIKDDIESHYAAVRPSVDRRTYAFRISATAPPTPGDRVIGKVETAQDLFETASNAFVQSRYFYEQVSPDDWVLIVNNVPYMLKMSEALETLYAGYLVRGSR